MRCERDAQLVAGAQWDREGASSRSMGGPEPDMRGGKWSARSEICPGGGRQRHDVVGDAHVGPRARRGRRSDTDDLRSHRPDLDPGRSSWRRGAVHPHVSSAGWPPFLLPDRFFVVCAVFVYLVTIEMFIYGSTSSSGRQRGTRSSASSRTAPDTVRDIIGFREEAVS